MIIAVDSGGAVLMICAALADRKDVREQKMFGGIAFMVAGSLACGIIGDELRPRPTMKKGTRGV